MPLHERSSARLPAWGASIGTTMRRCRKEPPLSASSLVKDAAHLADLAHLSHHLGHATRPFAQRMPPCRAKFVGYTLPFSTILHSCVSHDPHTFDPDNLAREVPAMYRNARRWTSRPLLVDSLVPRWLTVGGKGRQSSAAARGNGVYAYGGSATTGLFPTSTYDFSELLCRCGLRPQLVA